MTFIMMVFLFCLEVLGVSLLYFFILLFLNIFIYIVILSFLRGLWRIVFLGEGKICN